MEKYVRASHKIGFDLVAVVYNNAVFVCVTKTTTTTTAIYLESIE